MTDNTTQYPNKHQILESVTSLGCDAVRGILLLADNNKKINELHQLNKKDAQFVIMELRFLMKIKDT